VKRFLRIIRGVVGTGLTWAVGWAGLFGVVLLGMASFGLLEGWDLGYTLASLLKVGGAGFAAGGAFGVVLSSLEGGKKLKDLSLWRIALWGGVGGLVFAAVLGPQYLGEIAALWLLGVGSASGSVALARRDTGKKLLLGAEEQLLIPEE
jgi:hypothetical protein